jgi:hypothetical protein
MEFISLEAYDKTFSCSWLNEITRLILILKNCINSFLRPLMLSRN